METGGGGGVQPLFLCRVLLPPLGLAGRESKVREPRGEEVLLVELEEEEVLAGGAGHWLLTVIVLLTLVIGAVGTHTCLRDKSQ